MKPPELPLQAGCPAMGLPKNGGIVALYPPVVNEPPAAVSSLKAPPLTEMSSWPPSKPGSVSKRMLKESCGLVPMTVNVGESRRVTPILLALAATAAFGGVWPGATARPVFDVAQAAAAPDALENHPAGRAGATTPSKFSERRTAGARRSSRPSTRSRRTDSGSLGHLSGGVNRGAESHRTRGAYSQLRTRD